MKSKSVRHKINIRDKLSISNEEGFQKVSRVSQFYRLHLVEDLFYNKVSNFHISKIADLWIFGGSRERMDNFGSICATIFLVGAS